VTDLPESCSSQMKILWVHFPAELVCLDVQLTWDVLHMKKDIFLVNLTHQRLNDGVHALILGTLPPAPAGG
jgi:hypothetical protein